MFTVEEWKRRIVKFFVMRSYFGNSYRITNEAELFRQFASNYERNTQTAYEELLGEGIIEEIKVNPKTFYTLNFTQKAQEIEAIIKNEPFEEKSHMIKPEPHEFKGLREEFRDATSRWTSYKAPLYELLETKPRECREKSLASPPGAG